MVIAGRWAVAGGSESLGDCPWGLYLVLAPPLPSLVVL